MQYIYFKNVIYSLIAVLLSFTCICIYYFGRYARNYLRTTENLGRFARAHRWKPLTVQTFKSFLAIFFNMGIVRKTSIEEYWNSMLPSQLSSWFKTVSSRNTFQNILKFLHVADYRRLADRQHPAYDPAARFKPLLTFINRMFQRFLIPNQELCVDETLVSARGHSIMRQYIPTKAAKFGIKFWMLCEAATGYVIRMMIYRGRQFDPTPRGELQGTHVVETLLRETSLFNKGYHVFCDSYFTSLNLASRLLTRNTYVTGTLRKNRPMPRTIQQADPQAGTAIYMRQRDVLCVAYKDEVGKKPVRMLSTLLPAQDLQTGRPNIIHQYNRYMGAVDSSDAVMSAYSCVRRNKKVWKKVVLHLFHRIMMNAYILYKNNTTDRVVSRLKFIQMVIEDLAGVQPDAQVARPRPRRCHVDFLPQRKEKDCCVCSSRARGGIRRRSRTACTLCRRGLHRECIRLHHCIEM
ncbi:piggyBac transposable element-derived protein 4-like [Argopecten irradians]|uniref:piggyBac transposable element-derived protein 4-like n=1 Tax=Argopecten irradians TaxID=31199 RepID=UPI00371B0B99